jgi:hypothetical protein
MIYLLSAGILADEKELCLKFKTLQEKKHKEKEHQEKKSKAKGQSWAKTSDDQSQNSEMKEKCDSETNKGNSFVGPKISL